MNSIPLIKGNTPQEINTSIISLKKALAALEAQDKQLQGNDKDVQNKIKQINELINGINSHLDTIDGQITDLQPIDAVTSGDMHSVTSNAVAQSISIATDFSRQGAYCETAGATQAKVASMKDFVLSTGVSFPITFKNENTYNGKVTLNINNTGAKDVYLNGSITSSTNKLIRAGTYICWYSGSAYYIDSVWEVYRSRQSQIAGRASDLQAFSCTTASATVAKVVSHFAYSLSTRSEILVYFSNTNTATNPTLNVNGTGAKAIKIFGVQPNSTNNLLVAGTYRGFYDGTYWNLEPYGTTNEVASGNMHSVTSNAVASALSGKVDNNITIIQGTEVDNISTEVLSVYGVQNYDIGWISKDGIIITVPWSNKFGFQIALDDQSNWIAIRSKSNKIWNGWERIYQGFQLNPITNFSYAFVSGYSATSISIDGTNFYCSGINVFQLSISNLAGNGIGTTGTIPFGICSLRPKQKTFAIGFDYITGQAVRMSIDTDGQISVQESVGITSGNNQIRIVFTMIF
jgi:hypothetical protein